MYYNTTHIGTTGTGLGIVINVFAVRRELESPSRDTVPVFIRAFLLPKISGFKRSFPGSLNRVDKRIEQKKQAMSPLTTCTMTMVKYSGSWPFLHHVSKSGIPNALIVGMRQMSILTHYMCGDYRSWRKG
jgi:hypothetical protein